MNLYNQKNVLHTFVCKNAALTAATVTVTGPTSLNAGEVAFVDLDNKVLVHATTAIAAGQSFRIVQCALDQSTLRYSPILNKDNLVSKNYSAYVAPVQQVSYLGYVGSGTGNIEAIDQNEYILRVLLKDFDPIDRNKQMYKVAAYKSGNNATSADIALGLTASLYINFKREVHKYIQFDAICNNAGVANAATAGADFTHLTFTEGSTIVYGTDSAGAFVLGTDELIDTIAAGDFLRAGTAVTSPMYKIASYAVGTATTPIVITLDQPFRGSSTSIAIGSTEYITAADGAAALWGIKFTGLSQSAYFKVGVFDDYLVNFTIEPSNCGSTTVTYTTAAVKGNGTRNQVRELQWFSQGNLGNKWRIDVPPATMYDDTEAVTYNMYTLKFHTGQNDDSVTGTTPKSFYEIVIAIDDVTDTSGQNVYNHCANL